MKRKEKEKKGKNGRQGKFEKSIEKGRVTKVEIKMEQ